MADNTYSFLKESGFEPSLELLVRKILATTEHGKRYHLNIFGNKKSSLFQVDGYIVTIGNLENPIFKHVTNKELRARIVAQSFPSNKSNPIMEKAKIEFRQKYHCDLRGMKNGQEDSI